MLPKFWPNALFLSLRKAIARNMRSFHARSSLKSELTVLLSVLVSPTAKRAVAPLSEPVPATSFAPNARVPRINSLLNAPDDLGCGHQSAERATHFADSVPLVL